MIERLMPYLLVGIGGFLGANARYVLGAWIGSAVDTRFPLATLIVNVSGCFALGLLATLLLHRMSDQAHSLQLLLAIGFLGAYTTFSTFELENHLLLVDGRWVLMAVNVALSVLVGLAAVRAGIWVAGIFV